MTTMQWVRRGSALLLAAVVAGCSTDVVGAPTPSPSPTSASAGAVTPTPTATSTPEFVVATYDSSQTDGGMQAQLLGTGVVRNGCFFLRLDDPEPDDPGLVLPVFPDQRIGIEGSRTYFNGKQLQEGERIELGGGYRRTSAGADHPVGCRGESTAFLVGDY